MRILHVILYVTALSCYTALAQEATKAAAAFKVSATVIPANDGKWHTVLTTTIKNPTANDDLFIDVSQVNRITTTNATSSATPGVISSGDARLLMRVLVDGIVAVPGPIVFDEQLTQLTSNLQTFLSLSCVNTPTPQIIVTTSCVCSSVLPVVVPQAVSCAPPPAPIAFPFLFRTCTSQTTVDTDVRTTCSLVPGANETLRTLLSETIGHSYDFLATGVGGMGDDHIVQVQEMLTQTTTAGGTAQVVIGPQDVKVLAVDLKPAQ
jgi:hypothetical protein